MIRPANTGIGHRDIKPDKPIRTGITVAVTHAPEPAVRDRLVDLLVELLDERQHSERG